MGGGRRRRRQWVGGDGAALWHMHRTATAAHLHPRSARRRCASGRGPLQPGTSCRRALEPCAHRDATGEPFPATEHRAERISLSTGRGRAWRVLPSPARFGVPSTISCHTPNLHIFFPDFELARSPSRCVRHSGACLHWPSHWRCWWAMASAHKCTRRWAGSCSTPMGGEEGQGVAPPAPALAPAGVCAPHLPLAAPTGGDPGRQL